MDNSIAVQYFDEIYNNTYIELSTYVISRIRNIDDAKDLLQITYTSFYKRILKKGVVPFDDAIKYLKTIAKHELGRHFGYVHKNENNLSMNDEEVPDSAFLEISQVCFADIVLDNILVEKIWECIKSKGNFTYRIYVLYYTYNLPLNEIAEKLNVSLSCVKNRLYRTLLDLRNAFCEYK